MGNFDDFMRCKRHNYFNFNSPEYDKEKQLISVIINEVYNKYGVCMEYYVVSYDTKYDNIFGEDNDRRFITHFEVNGYFNLPKEDKIWTKFGIEGTDEIIVWISKRHFVGASMTKNGETYDRPQIGDVIKTDYSNYFYEITEVAEDTGQYFQSQSHVWELHIRPMKNEFIDTTSVQNTSLSDVLDVDDIFDITNTVDADKEDVLYDDEPGEKPNNDPFGNW